MEANATSASILIAIPCYGNRVMPRFGQARDFYFAVADLESRRLLGLERRCWNLYEEPQLVSWLRRERIDTILCGGIHPRFQLALGAEGIRVVWGFRGEVEEILQLWLRQGDRSENAFCGPFWGQENCTSRRRVRGACPRRDLQGEPS